MSDKPQIAVGLDAGSAFTRCVIVAMEEGRLRFLGHGEVPASGWHKSKLADPLALTRTVREAVHQAEDEARVVVDAMVVGMGGLSIDGHNSRGIYEFGRPRSVSIEDMAYAVERSEQVRLEDDRAILHLFPQDFTLDGRSGKRYPRGSVCSRLEANVHLVTVSEQEHDSICDAVHQASYAVEETVFEPVAAAYASDFERRSRARSGGGGHRHALHWPGNLRRRSGAAGAQPSDFSGSSYARCRYGFNGAVCRCRAAESGIWMRHAGTHFRQQLYRSPFRRGTSAA